MPFLKQCQFYSSGRVHILVVRRVQRVGRRPHARRAGPAMSSTYREHAPSSTEEGRQGQKGEFAGRALHVREHVGHPE
jgi:hypothetical protein